MRPQATRFASWLRGQLVAAGLSPREAAEAIGVRPETLRGWLAGTRRPTPASCQAISDALGAPVNLVLEIAGHDRYF